MAALVETPLARIPFGRYQLLHRLARGGMAETFRAQLTGAAGVTKPVVIKRMLPSHAASSTLVAEFINEARIGANLSHGNIAQVLDFGCVGSNYYLALELVDGCSLAQLLKRSEAAGSARVPVPVACAIAIEVLKGLHHAHSRRGDDGQPLNIVHRDISPENILISFEGETKVVDFGVAKSTLPGRDETEPGMVKGCRRSRPRT
jgi:serine/threonine protein kinase